MIYSIKAAAMATGVSESCLRTWERRYGVPNPDRTQSGRRRFDEVDLNVIRRMAALTAVGMPASEAAAAVKIEGDAGTALPDSSDRQHPLVDLLVQKSLEFDHGWLLRIVRDSVFSGGWAPTMERIVFPALSRLAKDWGEARASMGQVRFAHEVIRGEVAAELAKLGAADGRGTIILACAEDEEYDIAALSLSLLLRQERLRVVFLGRGVPASDLIESARTLKPAAVCIVGTRRVSPGGLNRSARAVVAGRVPVQLFVGGSVLTRRDAPDIPGIHLPQSLVAATERIVKSICRD